MMHLLPLTEDLLRSRAREIIVYLQFLQIAVENDAHVSARATQLQRPLDKALTHMMKANVSLLLYSTMEACMVQLLDEMHNTIGQNCQGTDQLNAQLVLMVANHFKTSKAELTLDKTHPPLHECLFKAWLTDWQNRNQREKRQAGLSGSVDSLAIFQQLSRFGVFAANLQKPPAHLTHSALQSAKGRRNQLAHGEISFTELGQNLIFGDLCKETYAVFRTLRRVAQEVSLFLKQQRYLAMPSLGVNGSIE